MWGLVFVAPLWLADYPALLQSAGRYLAFGLIALPLAWLDRKRLAQLSRADWLEALKLSAVGNLLYYAFLASSIQRAGAPLPTMIIGTLPVVIAISSNLRRPNPGEVRRDGRLPWLQLLPSLLLIACGIGMVNHAELTLLQHTAGAGAYALGAVLAIGAVACWTWYPIRNADWLRAHAGRNPGTWATAQGITTLPLALLAYLGFWGWSAATGSFDLSAPGSGLPLGPRPAVFVAVMGLLGLLASWLGTLCWNGASQRLPTALVGQLIVFETLSALAYAFVLRGQAPGAETMAGIVLLLAGVMWALRVKPEPALLHGA